MRLTDADDKRVRDYKPLVYDRLEDCPFEVGQVLIVEHDRLWITIERIRRTKKAKWVADYLLTDFRPAYHGIRTRQFDEESGLYQYEPEGVGKSYADRIAKEAEMVSSIQRVRARKRLELVRYEREVLDARSQGHKGTERTLKLKIRRVQDLLKEPSDRAA